MMCLRAVALIFGLFVVNSISAGDLSHECVMQKLLRLLMHTVVSGSLNFAQSTLFSPQSPIHELFGRR